MRSFRSKPVGWRYESRRHSLAAKGISTKYGRYAARKLTDEELEKEFKKKKEKHAAGVKIDEDISKLDTDIRGVRKEMDALLPTRDQRWRGSIGKLSPEEREKAEKWFSLEKKLHELLEERRRLEKIRPEYFSKKDEYFVKLKDAKYVTLFHGTQEELAESIKKHGLIPMKTKMSRDVAISLTPSIQTAVDHAGFGPENEYLYFRDVVHKDDWGPEKKKEWEMSRKPVVVKVKIPRSVIETVNPREIERNHFLDMYETRVEQGIPPKYIKILSKNEVARRSGTEYKRKLRRDMGGEEKIPGETWVDRWMEEEKNRGFRRIFGEKK